MKKDKSIWDGKMVTQKNPYEACLDKAPDNLFSINILWCTHNSTPSPGESGVRQ